MCLAENSTRRRCHWWPVTGASTYLIVNRCPPSGVIERDVALQRVGSCDVIVVAVLPAPHESAGLIFAPRQRLEHHFDKSIGDRDGLADAPRKRAAAGLFEHVGLARGGGVGFDRPVR